MKLGDKLIYDGRTLILRGLDPMSVADPCAQLEDPDTGEVLLVPLAELEPPSVSGPGP